MFCRNCGNPLPQGTAFCPRCGAPAAGEMPSRPMPRVGFSNVINSPEFIRAAKKLNRQTNTASVLFLLLPLIGLPAASLFIEDFPFPLALLTGGIVFLIMLVGCLVRTGKRKGRGWDGVVLDKKMEEVYNRSRSEDSMYRVYDEVYHVTFRTDAGKIIKTKEVIEKTGINLTGSPVYDSVCVGDRVRYHPAFDYYEKYDKSALKFIKCPICKAYTSIEADRCQKCGTPLLK